MKERIAEYQIEKPSVREAHGKVKEADESQIYRGYKIVFHPGYSAWTNMKNYYKVYAPQGYLVGGKTTLEKAKEMIDNRIINKDDIVDESLNEADLRTYRVIIKRYDDDSEQQDVITAHSRREAEDKLNSDEYIEYWDWDPSFEQVDEKLVQSSSDKAFKKNIATEIKAGKNPKQAAAIAYSIKRKNESINESVPVMFCPKCASHDDDIDYLGQDRIKCRKCGYEGDDIELWIDGSFTMSDAKERILKKSGYSGSMKESKGMLDVLGKPNDTNEGLKTLFSRMPKSEQKKFMKDFDLHKSPEFGHLRKNESCNEAYISGDSDVLKIIRADKEYGKNYHVKGYIPDFSKIPNSTVITLKNLNPWHRDVYATLEKNDEDDWTYTWFTSDGPQWNTKKDNYQAMREIDKVDYGAFESLKKTNEGLINDAKVHKQFDELARNIWALRKNKDEFIHALSLISRPKYNEIRYEHERPSTLEDVKTIMRSAPYIEEYMERAAKELKKIYGRDFMTESIKKINENESDDDRPLRVCRQCLMGIESHEGRQRKKHIYIDDEDFYDDHDEYIKDSTCDWCEESGFDELWELG